LAGRVSAASQRLKVFMSLDPVCPKCGPYEASEGIYPCQAKKKMGVAGQSKNLTSPWNLHMIKTNSREGGNDL
jgi:hypothetical protein